MFGQHDDKPKDDEAQHDSGFPHTPDEVVAGLGAPKPSDDNGHKDWPHPGTPLDASGSDDGTIDDNPAPTIVEPADSPAEETPEEPAAPIHSSFTHGNTPASSGSTDDLIDIKQEALTKLSPLVGHLDQTPDEKFRTLMMMIQASDDQSLVKEAYETSLKIDDEKTRAQALLDIVNEINYFTQHSGKPE